MSSTISSDDKTKKVKDNPSEYLARKVINVKDNNKLNMATNRAYSYRA